MSRLPFELLLALRYLRPKRTFVSIITLISVLGVTLGVAVLIIVISVMSGFDSQLRDKILGFNAHLKIMRVDPLTLKQTNLRDYAALAQKIAAVPQVKNVSPVTLGQVLVETEPRMGEAAFAAPYLRGIDPSSPGSLGLLTSNLVAGTSNLSGKGLLIGTDFATTMELRPGDRVSLSTPHDIKVMKETMGKTNEVKIPPTDFEIRGIFDTGYWEYNNSVIVCSLDNFQDMYDLGDDVHGLLVMLQDPYQATAVRKEIAGLLGPGYAITTWTEENTAMQAVMVEKNVMLYILFFIVIVAAFGITCTLITFVVLKTREIGVMKALGASARQVMWIFLSQSLVVSVLGVLFGTALGMLALFYRNEFLRFMRQLTGLELFPAKIYGFTELPALIMPRDILVICGGSLLICLLAAAFPAWNASRLKPVEALRHE